MECIACCVLALLFAFVVAVVVSIPREQVQQGVSVVVHTGITVARFMFKIIFPSGSSKVLFDWIQWAVELVI